MQKVKIAVQKKDGSVGTEEQTASVFEMNVGEHSRKFMFNRNHVVGGSGELVKVLSDYRTGWGIKVVHPFMEMMRENGTINPSDRMVARFIIDKITDKIGVEKFISIMDENPEINL